jgi:hypothetical protein
MYVAYPCNDITYFTVYTLLTAWQTYTTNTIKDGEEDEFAGFTIMDFDRPDGTMIGPECE